jgi:UDP-glucose:(heptosyl)LPS alpha-1,3-glucosyltransferase
VFRPDQEARRAVRSELGLDEATPLALFVGGDWERKGAAFAVSALAGAPAWHLAIAGPGEPAPLIERATADGSRERLHLLGRVIEMPRVYAAADAFVFPTTYEAFPLVVLEAAASGLPLLVTRVNGAEELVEEGHNGWFIDRNSDDIARRLNQLRADRELALDMSRRARETVSSYTWRAMAAKYLALYAEVANGT